MCTWTSKVPKIMAYMLKIEGVLAIMFGTLEVQADQIWAELPVARVRGKGRSSPGDFEQLCGAVVVPRTGSAPQGPKVKLT